MRLTILWITTLALVPAVAHAGGGSAGGGGPDWGAIVRHAVNLAILFGVLYTALKTPVGDFLKFRRNEVKDQLEASSRLKAEAEAKYAEMQGRIENFEAELGSQMAAVRSEAEAEQKRLIAQAEKNAEQLVAAAHVTVTEELRRARISLQAEAVDLAVNLATDALTKSVKKDDQTRLNGAYLDLVEGSVA